MVEILTLFLWTRENHALFGYNDNGIRKLVIKEPKAINKRSMSNMVSLNLLTKSSLYWSSLGPHSPFPSPPQGHLAPALPASIFTNSNLVNHIKSELINEHGNPIKTSNLVAIFDFLMKSQNLPNSTYLRFSGTFWRWSHHQVWLRSFLKY